MPFLHKIIGTSITHRTNIEKKYKKKDLLCEKKLQDKHCPTKPISVTFMRHAVHLKFISLVMEKNLL